MAYSTRYSTSCAMESQHSRLSRFLAATKRVFSCRRSANLVENGPTNAAIPSSSNQSAVTPSDMASSKSDAPKSPAGLRNMRSVRNLFRLFTSKHDSCVSFDGVNDNHPGADEHAGSYDHHDTHTTVGRSNEEDKHDRRDFEKIRSIPLEALQRLVLLHLPVDSNQARACRITHRKEGSFHHCIFLAVTVNGTLYDKYVLRIPAHGTALKWEEADAYMLRQEALLMQHIRHHTECPIPEVVAFDETLGNAIGAPFILMKKIPGMSAEEMWIGQHLPNPPEDDEEYLIADQPQGELRAIRMTFLHSLARAMSQLHTLKFDQIGVPVFDNPEDDQPLFIGPVWRWHSKLGMNKPHAVGPFMSSAEFFQAGLAKVCNFASIKDDDPDLLEFKGLHKLLSIILASEPFVVLGKAELSDSEDEDEEDPEFAQYAEPADEYFVLRHDDLDLQNILVDSHGNVTGIIDWDGCMAAPRCVGYASLPTFLRRDWLDAYDMSRRPWLTWSFKSYRDIYTAAMAKACSKNTIPVKYTDAKFTRQSAMYQAVLGALYEDEGVVELVQNVLAEIDVFRRVDITEFCSRLVKGWPAAEKVLKEKMARLLDPFF